MIKPFTSLLLLLLLASTSFAQPFLASSPSMTMTDENTSPKYVIQWAAGDVKEYAPQGDGSLKVDLAGLSDGLYEIEVWAKNVWAVSEHVLFKFIKATPDKPGVYIIFE